MDVYFTPIIMKKSRPANKVSVLSSEKDREILSEILLRDTSSFGVRFYRVGRMVLEREIKSVKTSWGLVKVKIGKFEGEVVQISPEYEDCKIISLKKKVSIKMIHDEARLQAIKI